MFSQENIKKNQCHFLATPNMAKFRHKKINFKIVRKKKKNLVSNQTLNTFNQKL